MKVIEYFYKSIVFSLILNIVVFYTFAGSGKNKKKDGKNKYSCKGNKNSENSDVNHDENNDENNDENKKKAEEQKLKKRIEDIKNQFGLAKKIDINFQYDNIENLDNVKTLTELDDLLKEGTDLGKKVKDAEATIDKKKDALQNEINESKGTYDDIFKELKLKNFGIKQKDFSLSLDKFNEVADLDNINTNLNKLNKEIKGIKEDFAKFFIKEMKNIIKTKEGFELRDFVTLLNKDENKIVNLIENSKLGINKISDESLDPLEDLLKKKFSKIILLEINKDKDDKIVLFSHDKEYKLLDNSKDKDTKDKFTAYGCDNVDNINSLTYEDDKGVIKFKKIYFNNKAINIPKNRTFISYICKEDGNIKFFFIIKLTDDVEDIANLIKLFDFCSDASEIAVVDSCEETNSVKGLFANLESLKKIDFSNFKTVCYGSLEGMFSECSVLESLDLSKFDTSRVINMACMFSGCSALKSLDLSNFNTSNVTDMNSMFYECSALESLDLSNFNTSRVINMAGMFRKCSALESLDLSKFDTKKVTTMECMFSECSALKSLDLSNFITSNVKDMQYMFYGCSALGSLDLSNFITSNVKDMQYMFYGCSALGSLDLSKFDTKNVTTMKSIFENCEKLKEIKGLNKFNTTNVTNMYSMFCGCSALKSLDLSNFNTTNVTNMGYMFFYCSALELLNLSKFDISNVKEMSSIFTNCSNLTKDNVIGPEDIKKILKGAS